VRFAELAETSRAVAGMRRRLAKIERLADAIRRLAPEEVALGVACLAGELPAGRIGVGYAAVRAALADLPDPEPGADPTLRELSEALGRIAAVSGRGSAAERARLLRALFARCAPADRSFLAALLVGEVRQGALEGVAVDALARAANVPASEVRRALLLAGSLAPVAEAALAGGTAALRAFRLELFRPLQPMLAGSAEAPADALAQHGRAAFEWKLDGARIQVHRAGDDVRIYTRSLHEVSARAPELVESVRALPLERVVLDGEAISLRPDGTPHPFQVTMRRFGRRLDVAALRAELPLVPFFFDVLHVDGEDVLDRGAEERARLLTERVPDTARVPRRVVESVPEADAFLAEALARGHEGAMAKALDAPYEAGRRGSAWLKLKAVHTLDLVVLAVEHGSGRRRGFLSNLHLGARDPATGGFVMLGKTFKGMTDEMLAWQTRRLGELALGEEGGVVHVRPELVVEIAFDGVQASPHYPGGLALRFARLRRHRPDKPASEADTIDTVRALYERGARAAGGDASGPAAGSG
jgi:DNA ligase-1